jgi:bla regulator protein BlaR1
VLLAAARQIAQQRAYLRRMGVSARRDGIAYADSPDPGPALVGLWRPLIVVPSDFDRRYTATERELILAHERTHARRRDPLANAVCAALRCLNWFNPLVHIAERLMRIDQELACDAEVVRRHPNSRRSYADVMLKTQLSASDAPFACQWQSNHPLKDNGRQSLR